LCRNSQRNFAGFFGGSGTTTTTTTAVVVAVAVAEKIGRRCSGVNRESDADIRHINRTERF